VPVIRAYIHLDSRVYSIRRIKSAEASAWEDEAIDFCVQYITVYYTIFAAVRIPPWPGIFFKPSWCEYTLRVTSHKQYIIH
jgi:hypothetical protein